MSLWHDLGGRPVPMPDGFGLMGIINITPDSFYDGGACLQPDVAVASAERLLSEGASIIDIGAESTRPGARAVCHEEEWGRLAPCIDLIRQAAPEAAISIDTRNSRTAALMLEAGCTIVNDVSACRHDPAMLEILAHYKPGYVLMHCQGEPETMQRSPVYEDVVDEIRAFFEYWLDRLIRAGLPENRIVLDPGLGFGKNPAHNLALLRHMDDFLQFGRPLLAGVSMKGLFRSLFGLDRSQRGEATATLSALLLTKGVAWHRVHEVGRVRAALALACMVCQ